MEMERRNFRRGELFFQKSEVFLPFLLAFPSGSRAIPLEFAGGGRGVWSSPFEFSGSPDSPGRVECTPLKCVGLLAVLASSMVNHPDVLERM